MNRSTSSLIRPALARRNGAELQSPPSNSGGWPSQRSRNRRQWIEETNRKTCPSRQGKIRAGETCLCWLPSRLTGWPEDGLADQVLLGRDGLLDRDVDVVAAPDELSPPEREHDPERRRDRAVVEGLRLGRADRRARRIARDVHQAAHRHPDEVRREPARVRPRLAEARHRGDDDAGARRAQLCDRERTGRAALEHDVDLRGQAEGLLGPVDHDALLAAVQEGEAKAPLGPGAAARERPEAANRVPAGRLGLEHPHPEVGQQLPGQLALEPGQVEGGVALEHQGRARIRFRASRQRITSVAPSVIRIERIWRNQRSSGSSVVSPIEPWIWIARSTTLLTISAQ